MKSASRVVQSIVEVECRPFHNEGSSHDNSKDVEVDDLIQLDVIRLLDDAARLYVLKLITKWQVEFIFNFLGLSRVDRRPMPALDSRFIQVVVDRSARVAVLMHIKLLKGAIDHAQCHFERVLHPVILFLILGKLERWPVLFFLLDHLLNLYKFK